MGLNVWNIALEAKYKIKLEHGKVDMSFTYKSFTSELSHRQFVVAKFCFSVFHLSTWIHNKTKIPIIHASSDLWSLQDSDLDTFKNRRTKVHDYAIKKFLGLHFQLQWKHKCKAISTNTQWKSSNRISMYNQDELVGYLKPKRSLV